MLLKPCKDIGIAVNTGKTNYMEVGHQLDMMAILHVLVGINSYVKVKTVKYLGS